MKSEKRYRVIVSNVLGTIHDVDNPSFRSDDFAKLVNLLRRLYPNGHDAAYKKHTPKILDSLTNKEYFIFAA